MIAKQTFSIIAVGLGLTAVMGGSLLLQAHAQDGSRTQPAPQCKITPVQAIKVALGKVSGRPLQANFEFDEGKWVYGVMIVHGKTIDEVEIDPMTGKVGDVEKVTPEGEAKEVQAELTKAIGGQAASGAEKDEENEKDEKAEGKPAKGAKK